jgi:hypothetical protein
MRVYSAITWHKSPAWKQRAWMGLAIPLAIRSL